MKYLLGLCISILSFSSFAEHLEIYDQSRDRHIPIAVTYPENPSLCKLNNQCKVAFISAGYRVPYEKYSFVSNVLKHKNYLVIAVDQELPSDPPLSKTGDLYKTRIENWQRGARTLDFLQKNLSKQFPKYDFEHLTLIGHSNGGDISTWLANEGKSYVQNLITLDHKRVTLPKNKKLRILSVRATEYPTKEGVLLSKSEQIKFNVCIVTIPNSKHMDLTDYGTDTIKQKVSRIIESFLSYKKCEAVKNA